MYRREGIWSGGGGLGLFWVRWRVCVWWWEVRIGWWIKSVRRWTDISGAVHRGVSVRRLKIGFICVHYFFVLLFLLLLLIQGDDVNRRGVSGPRRGAAFCFSALLCKMAAINPHNDKGAQNGNLQRNILDDHGRVFFRFHTWAKWGGKKDLKPEDCNSVRVCFAVQSYTAEGSKVALYLISLIHTNINTMIFTKI